MPRGGLDLRPGTLTVVRAGGVALILGVVVVAWTVMFRSTGGADVFSLVYGVLGPVAYLVPGLVLLLRRDWHVVGWLLALYGMGTAFTFSGDWGKYPVGDKWVLLVQDLFEGSLFWLPMVALLLFFPDGIRDRTPGQRRVARAVLAVATVPVVMEILAVEVGVEGGQLVPNPLGIGFVPRAVTDATIAVTFVALAAAFTTFVIRYHSSERVARRQYRWVLSAITVLVASLAIGVTGSEVSGTDDGPWWIPILFAYLLVPASFMVAILRYRLYEIDRIISRTVSYAMVVGVLAAVFAAIAVGLPQLLRLPTDNQLLVAAATLAVAALFHPLRKRAQSVVDRRFDRTRYDAAREVDRFAERLRTELDLDELTDEALSVVATTLRPAAASVWIKERR